MGWQRTSAIRPLGSSRLTITLRPHQPVTVPVEPCRWSGRTCPVDPNPVADIEGRQRADGRCVEEVPLTLSDDAGQQCEMVVQRATADQPEE